MKITKQYLKQVIKESLEQINVEMNPGQETSSPSDYRSIRIMLAKYAQAARSGNEEEVRRLGLEIEKAFNTYKEDPANKDKLGGAFSRDVERFNKTR